MSTINVTNLSGRGGATPNLPDGANITGVATATTFDGNLKSTGTPTLGLGVTINSSGINVSGVLTATTLKGDGSNLTGVGESIAPWYYNPDVYDPVANVDTGIGITFNKKIVAGSGTATLKIVSAGVAGTTIQSWGISSFTQAGVTDVQLGSLVSDLQNDAVYQLDIPNGFVKDSNDTDFVGTAWTFATSGTVPHFLTVGENTDGKLGLNDTINRSSPVQISGATWTMVKQSGTFSGRDCIATKTDGTAWVWGGNDFGALGQNNETKYSSPVQLPGTTWGTTGHTLSGSNYGLGSIKTDGTLWMWGNNSNGQLAQNNTARVSSPVQIPGTTWRNFSFQGKTTLATKTDNTLWSWGQNDAGMLGQNNKTQYSSPVQVPGTTWKSTSASGSGASAAVKTDGTLWVWGENTNGRLGQNNRTEYSSPVQVPGTTWANVVTGHGSIAAVKTDGTLWAWGEDSEGELAQNTRGVDLSSPVQIPGTNWSTDLKQSESDEGSFIWIKTDGTLWAWGDNQVGQLGQNQNTMKYSSPVQIPGSWTTVGSAGESTFALIGTDTTP